MKVGIGYSDNPDTAAAGTQAIQMALSKGEREDSCDFVLLFATARHDQYTLREAVAGAAGASTPVYGGGAAGIITNDYYGYAGDQVAAACVWLDGVECKTLIERGLNKSEEETGIRLGRRLSEIGTGPQSPVMLFYDAFDTSDNGVRMLMATWLLEGIKKGLGFLPDLTGAGLMGDHICTPAGQFVDGEIDKYTATAFAFSGDIRVDSVIMHGCRPATGYFTVTKAQGPVILEINGKPAIRFIDELIESAVEPEEYPFFLIFGVNHGDRWGEYDEDYYASRLCLAIDKDRGGIVMFEPDMIEGTEFRLMFRALDLDYIPPKIEKAFDDLGEREPVFAIYIDCAGRCSGYGGMGMEDAPVIQKAVAGRAPVLGLYTGVEIASIGGRPRGLDWTGVFCLFSQRKAGGRNAGRASEKPVWNKEMASSESKQPPVEAAMRLAEQNAARILSLQNTSIAIRHELEQKRRGFSLLAELSASLKHGVSYESVFIPAAKRINAALNMQRTIVMLKGEDGLFVPEVLQGYGTLEKAKFAGLHLKFPAEMLDTDRPVLVTGADPEQRLKEIRELFGLPYFISSPVVIHNEIIAVLITGRLMEAAPFLVRLSQNDAETMQAISALLASVAASRRLAAYEERNRIMIDTIPICCTLWDENGKQADCNQKTLSMFGLSDRNEYIEKFPQLSPEYQPDGRLSSEAALDYVRKAFVAGEVKFDWTHMQLNGELIPTEVSLVRVPKGENYIVVGYITDLRERQAVNMKMAEAQKAVERNLKAKNEFLASISHEIRTPMNAITAMSRVCGEQNDLTGNQRHIIEQGIRSTKLLTSAIETILDFSMLDSGRMSLQAGEFSIRDLINDICQIAGREAEKKSLSLRASVDSGVPGRLVGDSLRLQQALMNIVMNAVKFTEKGGIEINVSSREKLENGKLSLLLEVRDTGIGFSEEKITNIFTPFVSGDTSYSRKYEGLGMGLSVSNGLVALMGGKITYESSPGKGSVFKIEVPLSVPETKSAEEKTAEKTGMEALRGLRVLVAEDNSINQMIMSELLTTVGVEVTIAENGIQALDEIEKSGFDVVLMDIQMPEMDGLTATAQIRTDSRFADLPILAMTANAGAEHLKESLSAGMNDHLTKPVDVQQLYSALVKWGRRN
ncbi:MAG: response regulator [Acidobacteriota bacterium]|jgi:signal transduction histidine kinase/CheY-like chemotaxis protein|nr:response regulator [Acidobacteriota bacterium]